MKRTEIDRMVSRSQLQDDWETIIEANPEHIIVGYVNPENGNVVTKWYGHWTQCKGINTILDLDLMDWIKEKSG